MSRKITYLTCACTFLSMLLAIYPIHAQTTIYGAKNRSYTFQASTTDPGGDPLYYTFNWGDSSGETTVPSSGTVASGAEVSAAHTWTDTGVFSVHMVACDPYQCSDLSDIITVIIAIPTTPGTPTITSGTNPSTTGS